MPAHLQLPRRLEREQANEDSTRDRIHDGVACILSVTVSSTSGSDAHPPMILGGLVSACVEGCVALLMVTAWPARSEAQVRDRGIPLHAPDESTIPEAPVGDAIRYGKRGR